MNPCRPILLAGLLVLVLSLDGGSARKPDGPTVVEWAPDGRVLIASQGLLARFDLDARAEDLLAENVVTFARSSEGDRLAVAEGGQLQLRSYPGFDLQDTLELPAPYAVASLAWSPDGDTLAAGTEDGHILLWEFPSTELWADLGVEPPSEVERLRFSADGARLLTAFADSRAVLWDIQRREVVHRFDWPRAAGEAVALTTFMDLSPDGGLVLANRTHPEESKTVLLDDRGRVKWSRDAYGLEFTPAGDAVLALIPPFRVAALFPVDGEARALRVYQPPDEVATLHLVRASPDEKFLVGVGEDDRGQVLILWDFATALVLRTQR